MKKTLSLIASGILIAIIGMLLVKESSTNTQSSQVITTSNESSTRFSSTPTTSTTQNSIKPSANVTIKDGIQYITLTAKRGYSPESTYATGGIPTKIIMKTNETYGCESALVIRSVKYQAYLPATGETEIDVGTPSTGQELQGTCGMGMYGFEVKYI